MGVPGTAVLGAKLVIDGARNWGAKVVETLSKVAIARELALRLVIISPTYTFCAMLIVCALPIWVQLVPFDEA